MVMEGGEVTIAGDDDYSLDPVMITIMMGETTGTATLTATDDYDVEGNRDGQPDGQGEHRGDGDARRRQHRRC
jgi:hypothetical protein